MIIVRPVAFAFIKVVTPRACACDGSWGRPGLVYIMNAVTQRAFLRNRCLAALGFRK